MHILMIEDIENDFILVNRLVTKLDDMEIQWRSTLKDGLAYIQANYQLIDVILLDLGIPDAHSLEALDQLQTKFPVLPIIILSSTDADELALEAVRHGAQDYLVKGKIDKQILSKSLRYAVERNRLRVRFRRNEELYRVFAHNFPNGALALFDHNFHYTLVDGLGLKELGLSKEKMEGKSIWEVFPPDMAAAGERRMRMVFAGGTVTDEIIYAGQTISMNYLPVRDASGTIISGMIMSQNITRRKQTEAALAAERNLLRTLIDSIPDYVYVKDTQSRFVLANQAVLSASGVENIEQLVGTTDFDHLPQAIAQSFYDDDCGVLSSGQPLIDREEASVDLKSGEDLWFSTTKVPLRDENSVVAGLVGVSRDIRQRKQLEATLKLKIEEEQQFQNYLKSLHEITVELTTIDDIDTFYKRAVELGLQRLGFDRLGFLLYEVETGTVLGTYGTDIHGQVVAEHDLRIDPSDLTSILKRALEKEERFAFDASAQLFSNLKLVGVGWNAAAVLWNGTDKLGWLAADNLVRHDPLTTSQLNVLALYAVTLGTLLAQKRSQLAVREREKELRQERDLLRTIIENSPDYISIKDIQGHFILANSALARISNLSVGEMIGKTSFDILSPELAVRFHEDDLRVLQSGEPLVNAERNIGDKVLLATKIPLRDKDGEITGIISLSRDITQHKQLERHKLELESERGRIKVLQRFINDMSHDFRTPLTAINNTLYLLKKNGDPQKQETYIQRAQRHIKRMDDLLEAILQIEYLDKGEIAFQFSWSDMNTFIPPLIQEYAPMSSPKQIVIKFVAEIDQCFALIDRVEFARVITKLLENGITYTPEGGHITFRTGIDQQWAVISIQDTGNGISADDLPHIFERFYRADQARSSDTGGSGLGLSIVQKIIEAHNGRIDVESVLGEGSKFTIRLPIAE